jgi:predicted secreted protein
MIRYWTVLVLFEAAALLLAGCGAGAPTAAPTTGAGPTLGVLFEATSTSGGAVVNGAGNAAVIGPDQKGGLVKLKVGNTFEVRIPTIPKQGYTWQPTNLDTSILEQLGAPVYTPDTSPNAAGGIVTLAFRVVGPGTAPIMLLYQQTSQDGAPGLSSNSFGVTVEAAP